MTHSLVRPMMVAVIIRFAKLVYRCIVVAVYCNRLCVLEDVLEERWPDAARWRKLAKSAVDISLPFGLRAEYTYYRCIGRTTEPTLNMLFTKNENGGGKKKKRRRANARAHSRSETGALLICWHLTPLRIGTYDELPAHGQALAWL